MSFMHADSVNLYRLQYDRLSLCQNCINVPRITGCCIVCCNNFMDSAVNSSRQLIFVGQFPIFYLKRKTNFINFSLRTFYYR